MERLKDQGNMASYSLCVYTIISEGHNVTISVQMYRLQCSSSHDPTNQEKLVPLTMVVGTDIQETNGN